MEECVKFVLDNTNLAEADIIIYGNDSEYTLSEYLEWLETCDDDSVDIVSQSDNTNVKIPAANNEQCYYTKVVLNSVLTYVACSLDNSSPKYVAKCCHDFYSAEELMLAKDILWDVGDKCCMPQYFKRRDTPGRTGVEATIDDIIKAVQALDTAGCMPKFAVDVDGMQRFPKISPTELSTVSICER